MGRECLPLSSSSSSCSLHRSRARADTVSISRVSVPYTCVSGRVFLLTSCVSPHTRPLRVRVIRVLGSVFSYTPCVSPHARPPVNPRDFHLPCDCVTRVGRRVLYTPRVLPHSTCRARCELEAGARIGGGGDCWSAWTRAAGGSPRPRLRPTVERPVIVLAISSPQRKVTRPCQANLTKPNAADVCVCVCVVSPAA